MTFGVLGPLVAADEHGPVTLKGPRQRAILARLLIARRRVVPVRTLINDLWEDPPDGALGAVQTFINTLRQSLEPGRAPRTPATLLVTEAPGYALRTTPDAVDADRFEAALTTSDLSTLDKALALWRGAAYAEFAEHPWARPEIARLDELRLLAVERRAEAALAQGQSAAVAADLRAHITSHPWREHAWHLLALALYRTGRQHDALDALRTAKNALVTELGVDPGPALRQLETDILAQAPHLDAPTATPATAPIPPPNPRPEPLLLGRTTELAQLTPTPPRLHLALISGEPGSGKTALAEALTSTLAAQGWITAWGRNPEHPDTPATWPWTQILTTLATHHPLPAAPAEDRFHFHRTVLSYVDTLARESPLLLVLDDLHRATEETLALLAALVTEPPPRPIRILATHRSTQITPGLAELLARIAPAEPTRVYLTGLPESATAELVRATTQRELPARVLHAIHERSGGNPFFARELARHYETEGDFAVPAGVREVIRHRLSALSEDARTVLRQAAVIGRDPDLDLLITLSGNENLVLDTLDAALLLGFLTESGPDRLRFAHALVRDTLYDEVSESRRARWHATLAHTLESLRPNDIDALAHHHLLAGSRAPADRRAHYAAAAARLAESRFAPHEAARHYRHALDACDGDPRTRLELRMGLIRNQAVTGHLHTARDQRADTLTEAESLGDPELTARVIAAFDVPGSWTTHDDPAIAAQVVAVTERTLTALPPHRIADRARLLTTLAMELRGTRSTRARTAAAEAESLARKLADPALLAFALNGRFLHTFDHAGQSPERAALGHELLKLATQHGLITFEVLAHLILIQANSAQADFATADQHATAVDQLAEGHQLPLVAVFTEFYAALRHSAASRFTAAEATYRAAATRLDTAGMPGLSHGLLPLALLSLDFQRDPLSTVDINADWGPYLDWVRPLALLTAGDRPAALAAVRALPDTPADLLTEARLALLARTALALHDRDTLERAHTELLPAAAELAGAGSGLLTFGPVAGYLTELATALDR
ncbi:MULTISPECIES: BTAD domain-containing putative transcriptional regulator [unclassified Crossiella]|uniref:BTAD domain-containing putative transcriptional regulator n=1 Tax=unclassified Crossiella TaxID=2620835 RepID=UPI001FFE932E|nr:MULTISPECIES: BTAD domain-containing putative transcriptional regulator [unclassified Crossiella]MCK2239145.1 AAA family ATPase [Crossiella sp. S99.2]MCK2251286.1 AAA family ATPase [Crossiella sp. S99.1]